MKASLPTLLFTFLACFASFIFADTPTDLSKTYQLWQRSMVKKDYRVWSSVVSSERRKSAKNRILSERRNYPKALFEAPFTPPSLKTLKLVKSDVRGGVAKNVYFGAIDFEVGGTPTKNLLVVSYLNENGGWKFNGAEYVNLSGLKKVRQQLSSGDYSYLEQSDFQATSQARQYTPELSQKVPIIAKAYVYCPGRDVTLFVNNMSKHRFQNAKEAELVIGGAKKGLNELQYSIKKLPEGVGEEPMVIRVYLMSEIKGMQPIKAYELLLKEKESPKPYDTVRFEITTEMVRKLYGK